MTPPPERDIDPITGGELEGTKKRSSEDAAEYPRRRATIAVGILDFQLAMLLLLETDKLRRSTVPDLPLA
jgi:hypothetical protein